MNTNVLELHHFVPFFFVLVPGTAPVTGVDDFEVQVDLVKPVDEDDL